MGKIHTITSRVTITFLFLIVPLILYPVLFDEKTFNETYENYKGLIWFVGLLSFVGLSVLTYINGTFQSELKKCSMNNNEKSTHIEIQNEQVIKNQKEHINELKQLNIAINKNFAKDNETVRAMNDLSKSIDMFRLELAEIKKKQIEHDNEIRELKKGSV